jgi:hypothetical protein
LSALLIGFIVLFATIVYWYLFRLMTWRVIIASAANVWCGFFIGTVFAFICRRTRPDLIAIAVETGIQNTGITFVIIRLALDSPFEDFAMTIPVAASLMSCIPLVIVYIGLRCGASAGHDRKSESKQKVYSLNGSEVNAACTDKDGDHAVEAESGDDSFDKSKLAGSAEILSKVTISQQYKRHPSNV